MHATELQRSKQLAELRKEHDHEAEIMQAANAPQSTQSDVAEAAGSEAESITFEHGIDTSTLGEALLVPIPTESLQNKIEDKAFIQRIKDSYPKDRLFSVVMDDPSKYTPYWIDNASGLILSKNVQGTTVTCVPRDHELITRILIQAHECVGHFGEQHTAEYIRRFYWWPRIVADTREFCKSCEECQQAKVPTNKPAGKLHPLPVPMKPWDSIGMDFIGPFPESKGYNYLWVIICCMTSMVHLIPVHTTMTTRDLSWIYLCEIVRLHGLPSSIVCD